MTTRTNATFCLGTQLDLFKGQAKQICQEKTAYVAHFPLTTLTSGPVEFDVPASPMYTDLSETRLFLRLRVVTTTGANLPSDAVVAPVNMLFHALFKKVDVYLGDRLITQSMDVYPWKAGLETLLNFGEAAKKSQLQSIFFYKDEAGNTTGMDQRSLVVTGSKPFELFGPLHVDFFFQEKYLLSNIPIRIVLTRSSPSLYLHAGDPSNAPFEVQIMQANLYVRRIKVSPTLEMAHARALEKSNAIYPMTKGEVEILPVTPGSKVIVKEAPFTGKVPKRIIMVALSSNSFNGGYSDSPFRFLSAPIRRIDICIDGEPVGDTPLSCDFDKDLFMRAYVNLFGAMDKSYTNFDLGITAKDFKDMYPMFCFDLTSDSCGNSSDHQEFDRKGTLRIVIGLKELTETIYFLFYGEFESTIEITKDRAILMQ